MTEIGVDAAAVRAEVETFRASHLELETERVKLAKDRAILEGAERRQACVDLVKAGRAPSTVWADDKCSGPKSYLAAMPIGDFRAYVADQLKATSKAKTPKVPSEAGAPGAVVEASRTFTVEGGKTHTLDARDLKFCSDAGCDPQVYATLQARMTPKKA